MKKNARVRKIAIAGLMAALCFVGYAVFPAINVSGTKIHIGNAFVIIGALLLGGRWGGMAGAIGLALADITMGYAASAPRTFISKLVIGLLVGLMAHTIGKIKEHNDKKYVLKWSIIASIVGLAFNCVFEPSLKWFWYTILIPNAEKAESAIKALIAVTTYMTAINAVINAVVAVILFMAIYPMAKKMEIL